MKVKDVMHKGVDWVSPDTPVTELAKLMREHDIGAIPIGENDRLIGMVTDRDIVCKGLAEDSFDASNATARDVMTRRCKLDADVAVSNAAQPQRHTRHHHHDTNMIAYVRACFRQSGMTGGGVSRIVYRVGL
jgi:CBS domain-containing protein